jgi:integrase/recombinase XerD
MTEETQPKKIRPSGMKDKGAYMEFNYLPELMKAARRVSFKSNPNIADMNECLVFLAFKTGRRPEELVRTRVRDIDFDEREINWNIVKKRVDGYQERIPIDIDTNDYLKWYIKTCKLLPHHYLFSWVRYGVKDIKNYTHLDRRRAWEIIKKASDISGIKSQSGKSISPRIARHSLAVYMRKKGKDISTIKEILAHKDITTTDIYTQFSRKDLRKQIDETFEDES